MIQRDIYLTVWAMVRKLSQWERLIRQRISELLRWRKGMVEISQNH